MKKAFILATLLALAAAVFAAEPEKPAKPQEQQAEITTADEWILSCDFLKPQDKKLTVIMIHGLGSSKEEWSALKPWLAERGIGYLAFDMRGHGKSTVSGDQTSSYTDDGWEPSTTDIFTAMNFLKTFKVSASDIVLVGASIGANLAVNTAVEKPVKGLVLFSPGLNYRGVKTEEAVLKLKDSIPVMLVAAKDDTYAWESSNVLLKDVEVSAPARKYVLLEGKSGHGVNMFSDGKKPSRLLLEKIVNWIERIK